MPVVPLHSLTSQSLDAKFANKQRRYQTKYSASYLHQPAPPPRLAAPPRPPNPMFEALRAAAAQLDLPEEHEQNDLLRAAILPAARHPVRKALLGTTAALALCALAASGYYAWVLRAPDGSLASGRTVLAALEQRFHDLTADQAVFRAISEKVALWRPVLLKIETAVPPVRDAAAENPPPRPAQPVAVPAAAMPGQPALAASLSSPPAASDASSPTEVAPSGLPKPSDPVASTPEAAGQATPASAQAEPVSPNAAEVAAPMPSVVTSQQLVNTFALVRQMGLLVRDMQAENEKLRSQVAGLTGTLQAKVTDLEQRLVATAHDMHDAHEESAQLHARVATLADTLQASSKASEQRLSLALARSAGAAEPGKRQAEALALPASAGDGNTAAVDAMASGLARTVRDYHVQAASLGVAVLGDANAAPGQGGRYLVAVGDQVPGVGRVISISQRGTAWVVQTDHGAIQ